MRVSALAGCLGLAIAAAGSVAAVDYPSSDVCVLVPGTAVARAAGGRLEGARLVRPEGGNARCVYTVAATGGDGEHLAAYVVWLMAPEDFTELRKYQDDPVEAVDGLGDEAFITHHPDPDRFDVYTVSTGQATVEVTGPDAATTTAVAAAALAALRPARGGS